jgi:8-oxo-dGTP pyrophosphatase MutT (NUDIX family)
MTDPLVSHLLGYGAQTEQEREDVERVLDLAANGDPWSRASLLHVTASALIVHPPTSRVLLRWHERQQAWLQVGGHADPGENDPLVVALREGAEEAGLADLAPWPSAVLQQVVIVPVPPNDREPAHQHADVRFFLATNTPESVVAENPTAELRWLRIDDALALTSERNVQELIRRAAVATR